ncbi:MAG: hypothetical protein GTN89_08400, partial [Acidobacteria bacterium]|nr:hypothetical protein [Acidobacteriota bacterium]
FNTVDTKSAYSSIIPAGGDVDFFRFKQELVAGELFSAEILRTQMDTTMGLFRCT